MSSPERKKHRSNGGDGGSFFSSWSFDERVFLHGLFKRYPCTKVHLMAKCSADPHRPNNCSNWPMWRVMSDSLRVRLNKYVEPRTLEAFFWHVIAEGVDRRTVTNRLDFLVRRNGALWSNEEAVEETDESEDLSPSDDENYSSYSPSADESFTTDSQESVTGGRCTRTVASSTTEVGNASAQGWRADCGDASVSGLLIAPNGQRGLFAAHVQEAGEHDEADLTAELQRAAQFTEGAVPVQEQDVAIVCNEVNVLNGVAAELSVEDAEVCLASGDGGTGDSFQQSALASGAALDGAEGGGGLICSSSLATPVLGDSHRSDKGASSTPGAEATRLLVDRADKEVQCDMFSAHWAEHIYRETMMRIEALKRQLSFYDEISK